jgi:glycosyltransferase involved in cell wall biosynthesis
MPDPGQRIAVCIITYRRPDGLRRALAAVAAQVLGDAPPHLRVIVVDNDGDGDGTTARVCDAARAAMAWPLDYVVEPRRGIPFARNRCVAVARPHVDWIAFIDDDEEPAPTWLAELVRVQRAYDADVVAGPVLSRFAGEVPAWVAKGKLFDRLRYPTGTLRDRAFTGNVMLRAGLFDEVRPHFDERMALSGGSDTHFSQRLHRAGYRIVWADEAEVVETVPASRVAAGWIFRRAYRIGATNGFIARDLRALPVAAGMVLPFSGYRMLKGGLLAAFGGVAGRHWVVAGIRQICYGAGMVVGLFGGRYDEYRRNHGS